MRPPSWPPTLADISSPAEGPHNPAPRLESLGELSGRVAHEFNNLLAVILGYASLIAHHPGLGDEVREDVDRIQLAAQRAVRLTRQMAILGRRETVDPEVLDVSAALETVPALLADSIGPNIHLQMDLPPGLGAVSIHRGQLEQAVVNLAENARDAMPDGGTLTIETSAAADDVRITVTDTGGGISPDDAAHAFDPFFTTKPKGEGTGLGLAIVYAIVTDAGGSVSIATTAGIGTSVIVLLPTA